MNRLICVVSAAVLFSYGCSKTDFRCSADVEDVTAEGVMCVTLDCAPRMNKIPEGSTEQGKML